MVLALRLAGTQRLEPLDIDQAPGPRTPGMVRIKLLAGAICGSDLAKYRGIPDPRWPHDGIPGFPLHEVVGRVLDSGSPSAPVGARVVGMSSEFRGLAEEFYADPALLVDVPEDLCDVHATSIQPLATVLCSVERMPDPAGKRVAIIGLGAIGALFAHVLHRRGAREVVAVDPVDRGDLRADFGLDTTVCATSVSWLSRTDVAGSFDLCVEAVGHQQQTFTDAVRLAAPGGHVVAFGVPDDSHYACPIVEMFRKQLTVQLGETKDWRRHLSNSREYLRKHADTLGSYITHSFPLARADLAFAHAARPTSGQLKVAIHADEGTADQPCLMPAVTRGVPAG